MTDPQRERARRLSCLLLRLLADSRPAVASFVPLQFPLAAGREEGVGKRGREGGMKGHDQPRCLVSYWLKFLPVSIKVVEVHCASLSTKISGLLWTVSTDTGSDCTY